MTVEGGLFVYVVGLGESSFDTESTMCAELKGRCVFSERGGREGGEWNVWWA